MVISTWRGRRMTTPVRKRLLVFKRPFLQKWSFCQDSLQARNKHRKAEGFCTGRIAISALKCNTEDGWPTLMIDGYAGDVFQVRNQVCPHVLYSTRSFYQDWLSTQTRWTHYAEPPVILADDHAQARCARRGAPLPPPYIHRAPNCGCRAARLPSMCCWNVNLRRNVASSIQFAPCALNMSI